MRPTTNESYERTEVLYDKEILEPLRDEYENATAIKANVETPAFIYEIRTALRYWFGGENNYRTNDRIWDRCKEIDNGSWSLDGTTITPEPQGDP